VASKVFRIVGVLGFILASEASASEVCMPSDELKAALIDWYAESPVQVNSSNTILWKSEGGETWTVVKYNPDGTACTLQHGTNWNGSLSFVGLNADINQ
jgi:hypothetical protein